MRPTSNQLQQLKLFHRQQTARHGAGVVAFNHGSAAFVPISNLHTLSTPQQQLKRMIAYADNRQDDSFVVVADRDVLVIAPDTDQSVH